MNFKNLIFSAALAAALIPGTRATADSSPSVGPMWGRYYVAAGLGEPGYKDGAFGDAELKSPGGLALSKDGTTLYVADTGNDAVRRVALGQNSKVDTLFGGPGNGVLVSPTALALSLDESSLYIIDGKRGLLMRLPSSGGAAKLVEAGGLNGLIDVVEAEAVNGHVGGGVVTERDHEVQDVAEGERERRV